MTRQELRNWRRMLGMTQLEFSQWIRPRRTPGIISQWEKGEKPVPEWIDTFKELQDLRGKHD